MLKVRYAEEPTALGGALDRQPDLETISAGEDGIEVVARYADSDPVLSGWALGEERLGGRGALVRVPVGAGDVVLFGFRPQFRGQPRGTFRLIFNAIHGAAAGLHRVAPPTGRAPPGPRSGTR